jgi:hypothetical protein
LGFNVTNNIDVATTLLTIFITEGRGQQDNFHVYFPSLQAVFSSSSAGTLFTFTTSGERAVAVRSDVARRRAFESLSMAIRENFMLDFDI